MLSTTKSFTCLAVHSGIAGKVGTRVLSEAGMSITICWVIGISGMTVKVGI